MRKVIDVHTHMFSALCLPIEGILREFADEDDGYCILKPVKRRIARSLAASLNLLAQSAQQWVGLLGDDWPKRVNATQSLDDIADLLTDLLVRESKRRRAAATKLAADADNEITEVIGDLMDMTGHGKAFSGLCAAHIPGEPDVRLLKGKLFTETLKLAVREALERLIGKIENGLRQARFLLLLLMPEERIARALLCAYDDIKDLATVEHFVPLMMDMELAYERYHGAPPVFDFVEKQIPVMGEVLKKYSPRLLGFVAFDPRRSRLPDGTVDPSRPLEIVRQGLAAGNVGVKYYPSMGYHPEMPEFQREHKALFSFCAAEHVPILTHCQWGAFKASNTWDANTDPYHWRNVLQEYKDLRVCFGHAGGGIYEFKEGETVWGWFSPKQWGSPNCFARKVVEVCSEYDGAYCDFSIFSEFMDGYDHRPDRKAGRLAAEEAMGMFRDRLEGLLRKMPTLGKKIMYGSDWHMPSMLGRPSQYLRIMLDMFRSDELKTHADDFFHDNATRFLGLPLGVETD